MVKLFSGLFSKKTNNEPADKSSQSEPATQTLKLLDDTKRPLKISPSPGQGTEQAQVIQRSLDPQMLLNAHFERMVSSWPQGTSYDWAKSIIRIIQENQMAKISLLAIEKMQKSIADGQRHSVAIWQGALCISISTFPCSVKDARRTYYPNGYLPYLDKMVNMARGENPRCHWVHLQFFWDSAEYWFQFTLFPCRKALDFDPMYQMPFDLLNEEEKKQLRLV